MLQQQFQRQKRNSVFCDPLYHSGMHTIFFCLNKYRIGTWRQHETSKVGMFDRYSSHDFTGLDCEGHIHGHFSVYLSLNSSSGGIVEELARDNHICIGCLKMMIDVAPSRKYCTPCRRKMEDARSAKRRRRKQSGTKKKQPYCPTCEKGDRSLGIIRCRSCWWRLTQNGAMYLTGNEIY